MTKNSYVKFRQELLGLMDEALSIEDISVEARDELRESKRTLQEDSFEIVLVGEFQGGKSTTFNALCDGREISPRGAMVKTSACRISAHNIADKDTKEYARITWKTNVELLKTIIDLVAPGVKNLMQKRFPASIPNSVMIGEISSHEMPSLPKGFKPLDITDVADQKLLRKVLDEEWEQCKENPVAYDQVSSGRQDMLYIATLIVDHFGSSVVRKHLSLGIEDMSITDLTKYVQFPRNWSSRWTNYTAKSFADEEALFAFVGRIDCFIHSDNLGKIGCVVTDCPGLFASDWDTRVATEAMRSAHAIAYLFGGARALSSQELVALQHIRSLGLEDNLFYVFNAHTRIGQAKNTIVPTDEALLRNQGYKLHNGGINVYHALLGLCSRNQKQIMNNEDEFSQDRFRELSERIYEGEHFEAPYDIWFRVADDNLYNYIDRADYAEIQTRIDNMSSNPGQIAELLGEQSGFDAIIGKIEKFVLQRRARALLVDRGANRVKSALNSALKTLDLAKNDAEKGAAAAEDECKAAERAFRVFQQDARTIIDNEILKRKIGISLLSEFVDEAFVRRGDEISDRVAGELAEDIASNKTKYIYEAGCEKLSGNASEYIHSRVESCFRKHFEKVISTAVEAWVLRIKDGKNPTFNEEFGYAVNRTSKLLHERWEEIKEVLPPTVAARLGGFDFFPSEVSDAAGRFGHGHDAAGIMGNLSFAFIAAAVAPMVVAGIVYSVIITIVANVCTGFIPVLIGVLVAVVAAVFAAEKVHSVIVRKIKEKLFEKLRGTVIGAFQQSGVREKIREGGLRILDSLKDSCAKMFNDGLEKQKHDFESRIAKTRQIANAYRNDLEKCASHYNDVITNHLRPMLDRLGVFIGEVEREDAK